jgi:hypothetical protein
MGSLDCFARKPPEIRPTLNPLSHPSATTSESLTSVVSQYKIHKIHSVAAAIFFFRRFQ